jgi:hypothetical protein
MKSASCVSVVACLTILSSVASAQAWPGGRGSGGAHSYDLPVSLVLEPHRQSAWRIQTQVGGELPVTVTAVGGVTDGGSASGASEVAVQVTDASGNPVPDILVGFQLDEGSATLAPAVIAIPF